MIAAVEIARQLRAAAHHAQMTAERVSALQGGPMTVEQARDLADRVDDAERQLNRAKVALADHKRAALRERAEGVRP